MVGGASDDIRVQDKLVVKNPKPTSKQNRK
jgi:hypothetical protein